MNENYIKPGVRFPKYREYEELSDLAGMASTTYRAIKFAGKATKANAALAVLDAAFKAVEFAIEKKKTSLLRAQIRANKASIEAQVQREGVVLDEQLKRMRLELERDKELLNKELQKFESDVNATKDDLDKKSQKAELKNKIAFESISSLTNIIYKYRDKIEELLPYCRGSRQYAVYCDAYMDFVNSFSSKIDESTDNNI